MPEGNNASAAAPVETSPSLASVVGQWDGDYTSAEPEPSEGAPPTDVPENATPEGTEPATDIPVAETPVPDQNAPDTSDDTDPLEGSKPLHYMVDGQQRIFEGVTVLKDGAGIIEPDALKHLERVVGERDHLFETAKSQYEKFQALEKATAWQQGDQTLTGLAGAEANRVYREQATATIGELVKILDPTNFAKYVEIGQNPDGSYFVQPDQMALAALKERLQFVTDRAGFEARKAFAQFAIPQAQPVQPAAETPVEQVANDTVSALAQQMSVTLSEDSKTFLAGELPRYVRPTTAAEKPQFGARIVDAAFGKLIQREASKATETAKIADSAGKAAQANAARIAAAKQGLKPGQRPASITPHTTPERTRDDDFDDAFTLREKAAAGALRAQAAGVR